MSVFSPAATHGPQRKHGEVAVAHPLPGSQARSAEADLCPEAARRWVLTRVLESLPGTCLLPGEPPRRAHRPTANLPEQARGSAPAGGVRDTRAVWPRVPLAADAGPTTPSRPASKHIPTGWAEWHAPKCGAGPRDHPGAPTPTPAWRHPCLPRSSSRTPAPGRPPLTSPRAGTRRAPSGSHAHPRGGSPRPGPWLAPCRLQKRRGVPFSLSYLSMKRDLLVRAD